MEYDIDIEKDNNSDILVSVVADEGHFDFMSDDYHRIDVVNEGAAVTPQIRNFLEHANSLTDIYFGASKLWDALPHASATILGGIKVGANLTIDVNGVLNGYGGVGSAVWGTISGAYTDQTDLITALNLKAPLASPTFTGTVTVSGSRPITLNGSSAGIVRIKGNAGGGWAMTYGFLGSADTDYEGFGALGGADDLSNYYIGTYTSQKVKVFTGGNVSIPLGGLHIGGDSDPGNDNLFVDGITTLGGNLTFTGAKSINTTAGILTLAPTADLDLTPGGNARVRATSGVRFQSDNYASQTTGWGISYAGVGDFRYLYADEVHTKSFIADLEQSLAGGQIIPKSVAPLAATFTVPAAGANATLVVESFKGFDSFKVFVDGDIVRLRQFDRTGTSLNIVNCWGTVVWVSTDTTNKTQTYTFTRSSAPNAGTATTSSTIAAGVLVLDYGTSGNGFLESNAIDGAMAEYAPYHQIVSWTTHPATGQTVRTRLGNLKGIFNVSNEYGLFAGSGIANASQYLRISDQVIEGHNLTIKLYDGAVNTVLLSPTTPSFAMGSTLPTGFLVGNGIWMGKDSTAYKMRVGSVAGGVLTNGFSWDGTNFSIIGMAEIRSSIVGDSNTTIIGSMITDTAYAGNGGTTYINYVGYQQGTTYTRNFTVGNGTGNNGLLINCIGGGTGNPSGTQKRVGIVMNTPPDSTFQVETHNGAGLKINYNESGINYLYGALISDSGITATGASFSALAVTGATTLSSTLGVTGAFGCNNATPQVARYCAAAVSYASGTYGLGTNSQLNTLIQTISDIRGALMANGIIREY